MAHQNTWIKTFAVIGLTYLVAVSTPRVSAEGTGEEFTETFDRLDPAVWKTVGRGQVEVKDGALHIAKCFVRAARANWKSYEIRFRARAPKDAEQVQIWAGFRCSGRERRYAVALRGGNCDDIYLCRYSPGGDDRMLALEPLDFHPEPGSWYQFRVLSQGGCIEVYLGDEEEPRVSVIDDQPIEAGQVVLGGGWIATEFDDLRVTRLPEDPGGSRCSGYHADAIKINFQDTPDELVPGWTAADERVYDKTRGHGWREKVAEGTRRRNLSRDVLKDTLAVVAHGQNEATFLCDLPDGQYVLTVCGGDPGYATHFEASIRSEKTPLFNVEVAGGTYHTAVRPVEVSDGQFQITFRSNHPQGQAGLSVCYMVLEKRSDVPQKWEAAKHPPKTVAKGSPHKERQRIARRGAYRPVVVERLPTPRCEVSLDGDWLFKPDYEVRPQLKPFLPQTGDDDWHVIRVPAFWNPTINWLHSEPDNKMPHGGTGVSDNYRQKEQARCEGYSFDYARTGTAWYRHWITLPEDIAGRHFTLRFDAVSKVADVWVNGKHVGGHVGMFGSFEPDVTDAVKPGRNLIAARVAIRKTPAAKNADKVVGVAVTVEITEDMLNSLPHGIYGQQGGIWQPVKLVVTDPLRIDDVFARTRTAGAEVDVTLGNYGPAAGTADLEITIRPPDEDRVVHQSSKPVKITLAPGEKKTVTLKTGTLAVRSWSPEEPSLYKLSVSLSRDGKPIDRTTTTIGFRTFEVRGNKFYLNGKPYWLRGASHPPMGLAANDARLADTFMKLMHDGNQMATRDVCAPLSETWFDAADRQGVAVSHEGPWPWLMSGGMPSAELLKVWKDEQASLVKQHRNHPSLFMYTMNNEMYFTRRPGGGELRMKKWKELSSTIRMVRRLDPTRPIVADSSYVRIPDDWEKNLKPAGIDDGDVDDRHSYYGWYEGTPFGLFDGLWTRAGYGTTGVNPGRPYISQECSTGYPNNDTGHPTRSYLFNHYTPQAFVGRWAYEDHDPAVFLNNRAFVSKELAEVIRRTSPDAAGVLHFANICWFRNVYDAQTIEPYPTYYAMKLALQPVLVSAELFGRTFYAGTSIGARVCVVNDGVDGAALAPGRLRWQIRHAETVLSEGSLPVPEVEHYGRGWLDCKFDLPDKLPAPRTGCRLVLALYQKERSVSENSYDLTVARRDWVAADDTVRARSIGLFDPGEQIRDALSVSGVKTRAVRDLQQLKPADCNLLIVAGVDGLSEPPPGWLQVKTFAEGGGAVLLVHPGKHLQSLLPEYVESVLEEQGQIVNMRVPESRVFDGLGPGDLRWWNVESGKTPHACRRCFRTKDAENLNVLATYLQVHWYMSNPRAQLGGISGSPLFEVVLGKGRLLVSEMAIEAAAADPMAARLLVNMLADLAAGEERE